MITYYMDQPGSSHTAGIGVDALTSPERDTVKARASLEYVSTLYVQNTKQERYVDLKTQLDNDYIPDTSNFLQLSCDST